MLKTRVNRLLGGSIRFLKKHPWVAFIVMGLTFIGFGLISVNLLYLIQANVELVLDYGTDALFDGALQQLFELCGLGFSALAFYLLFKVCEKLLVEHLASFGKD